MDLRNVLDEPVRVLAVLDELVIAAWKKNQLTTVAENWSNVLFWNSIVENDIHFFVLVIG